MSTFSRIMEIYNFIWMLESHSAQRLAWRDAEEMRIARMRAEAQAATQSQATRSIAACPIPRRCEISNTAQAAPPSWCAGSTST